MAAVRRHLSICTYVSISFIFSVGNVCVSLLQDDSGEGEKEPPKVQQEGDQADEAGDQGVVVEKGEEAENA